MRSVHNTDRAPLTADELRRMDGYWRACNYMCAGMIYLRDNPLLREPLLAEHTKNRLLGHWGSDPGQTFIWVHLNRVIRKFDLNMIYLAGPGHGAPAMLSNCYLEGTYSEVYPEKSQDETGMLKLFRAFSFPGQLGSHCTPEVPGSIHEGGSSATASPMHSELLSTTLTLLRVSWWGTARQRPGRLQLHGIPTNF